MNNYSVSETAGIQEGLVYVNKHGKVLDSFPRIENKMIPKFKQYSWDNWNSPNSAYRLKESYYILQKKYTSTND